ncbi:MAG: LytTR family DNA-binding domain-containing protein [Bacteroidales bacterium]|jgi:DNA-binding LytR/AlgR family response regulator|nr:LytTR family DNA-binding domain-containing protein [Bacteroidales bacterium]
MKLQCVIVDDEPLALVIIEGYLQKIPYIEIVGKFDNAIPVYEFLKNNTVDLLLLDIEMPNLTGIDFLKSISNPPAVILTTANKNYAIEGFDLNVEDYILKPITFNRLFKSISRIYESINSENKLSKSDSSEFLYLKENKKMVKVFLTNILYLESIKDYVKVVTLRKTVITKQQLSHFESTLNNNFLRIHRSFIAALNKIDSYSFSSIDINKTELPIGRKYKETVIDTLEKLK